MAATSHSARFSALDGALSIHEPLWRPAPFHVPDPPWCGRYPALVRRLLDLSEGEVDSLAGDNHGLISLLAGHVPAVAALHGLIELPGPGPTPREVPPPRLLSRVPGRKQAQILAFAAGAGEVAHPVLEWCAGKGHLGRLLAWRQPYPVASLEILPDLVEAGRALADHHGLAQAFIHGDALAADSAGHLAGRHAVALHACGDLHLALLRGLVDQDGPALDLAPCCYYRTAQARYAPLCPEATLSLSRDELHLAVTETVTAGRRDRLRSDRAAAWKLAFLELRGAHGTPPRQSFKPVPDAWLGLGFAGWMQRLCVREGVPCPPGTDWEALERRGWARHARVRRLDLVRMAFRRPLELWLVLDRAVFLERHGYRVRITEFCSREITPRNLLISARR